MPYKDKKKKRRVMKVREITAADVEWISLVDRGANQAPIRIVKRDEQTEDANREEQRKMNILKAIGFNVAPKADGESPVIGVVVSDEAMVGPIRKAFADAGIELNADPEMVKEDQRVYFRDGVDPETEVIRYTAQPGVEVVLSKNLFDMSEDFSENLAKQHVLPSLAIAADTLTETIFNVMMGSEEKTMATAAVDEFAAFAKGVIESVPETVLKLLAEVAKVEAVQKADDAESEEDDAETKSQTAGDVTAAVEAEVTPEEAASVTKSEDEGDDVPGSTEVTEEETSDDETLVQKMTELAASMASIAQATESVSSKVDSMETRLETVSKTAEAAEKLSKQVEGSLKGKVAVSDADSGDADQELLTKGDGSKEPLFEGFESV